MDHEHLSEMAIVALCCEMSEGDGVASDLVERLNAEEPGPAEKFRGQQAHPVLQSR